MGFESFIGPAVIAAIVTGIISIFTSVKKNSLEYITKERSIWRDDIRRICVELSEADFKSINKVLTDLKCRINSYGKKYSRYYIHDAHIWECIEEIENICETDKDFNKFKFQKRQLVEYLSLLTKREWEKTKSESTMHRTNMVCIFSTICLSINYIMYTGLCKRMDVSKYLVFILGALYIATVALSFYTIKLFTENMIWINDKVRKITEYIKWRQIVFYAIAGVLSIIIMWSVHIGILGINENFIIDLTQKNKYSIESDLYIVIDNFIFILTFFAIYFLSWKIVNINAGYCYSINKLKEEYKIYKNINEKCMNNKCILDSLKNMNDDFNSIPHTDFDDFKIDLERKIKECGRSLEDQKIEAISVLAEKKNDNSSERISISLAFASIVFSILLYREDKVGFLIVATVILIGTIVICSFNSQRKRSKIIAYYTIKLQCIENIEKDMNKR